MAGGAEVDGSVEVEWQLDALDLRPVERWLEANLAAEAGGDASKELTQGPGETRILNDVYLDTEDWRLFRAGYSLRVRRRGRAVESTLKSLGGHSTGPVARTELTESIDLSVDRSNAGPVGGRVAAVAGRRPLVTRVRLRTQRRTIPLLQNERPVAELSLDRSLIALGPGQEAVRLRRVEVEILHTSAETAVGSFVEDIRAATGLRPSAGSKFEVSLLALGIEPESTPDLGPDAAGIDSTLGDLAFAVMRRQARAMLAHEPGARLGEDPEELHDMRVAIRRLRAALTLFHEALPVRGERLRLELGWVGRLLGAVRDLDVQIGHLDELEPKEREDLVPLRTMLTDRRDEARAAMLEALDSPRYERLVRGVTGFLRQGPLRRSPLSRAPAVAVAPDLAEDRYRSARREGDRLRRSSPPERFHRTRIRMKKLRYSLEFFEDLFGPYVRDVIASLVRIQDRLGEHQDAVVAAVHLRDAVDQVGPDLPPRTLFAMGALAERYDRRARRLRRRFPKVYAGLDAKSWRRLGRQMAKSKPPMWNPPRARLAARADAPPSIPQPEATRSTST